MKKSSHFTPKLIKRPVRRKINDKEQEKGVLTPPSSQFIVGESTQTSESSDTPPAAEEVHKEGSEINRSFNLSSATTPTNLQNDGDEVDPKEKDEQHGAAVLELLEQEVNDEEDYGDNDIFQNPRESVSLRRHSSIRVQRRLSGITPNVIRNRSGSTSISITSTVAANTSKANEPTSQGHPIKIGIPVTKPSKRRASTASVNKLQTKKPLLMNPARNMQSAREETVVTKSEPIDEISSVESGSLPYVYGIDPRSNKLRKFRSEGSQVGLDDYKSMATNDSLLLNRSYNGVVDDADIPVAPRNLNTLITSIKQLPRKIEDSDLSLLSKVGVDYNSITMEDLCKPNLPLGEVSDNYHLVKEAQEKIRKEKIRKRVDRMRARTERRALDEVSIADKKNERKKVEDLLNIDDHEVEPSGIQLSMRDGNIVVNEESTVINRHRRERKDQSREESNPFENPITSSTYSKRKHTDRWTPEELKQFYNALSTWGTDFTFIAQLFPYRTRRQIKLKFNLEEKKYPEIVEMALRRKLPADFDKYCESSNNRIETLEYYNEELKQIRIKHEQDMAMILEERQRALKEDAEESRRREIRNRVGSSSITRAEKVKELRRNEMVVGSIDDLKKKYS